MRIWGSTAAVVLIAVLNAPAHADGSNASKLPNLPMFGAEVTDEAFKTRLVQWVARGEPADAQLLAHEVENVREFHERQTCVARCRQWLRAILEIDPPTGTRLICSAITNDAPRAPSWAADLAHTWLLEDARLLRSATVPVESIAPIAEDWLLSAASRYADSSKTYAFRSGVLRLGATLIAAIAGRDFSTGREYVDAYRQRTLPLQVLAEALERQASGDREIAEYFLDMDTPEALDAYLLMGVALPQAEPALLRTFLLCSKSPSQWSRRCAAVHRQLALLDTPNARGAIGGTSRPMTDSESSAKSYQSYRKSAAEANVNRAFSTFVPALVLSASGVWQLAAWQEGSQPGWARTPLVTVNGGLTGGALVGTSAILGMALLAKGGSDPHDGGYGLAGAMLKVGLLGAGLGAVGGSALSYDQRGNRTYYQTVALSEIIWPLFAAAIIYATDP